MAEPTLDESLILDWTTAIEALDYDTIQEIYSLQPQLLWEPLQPLAHLESDFSHFIRRLEEYKILGTSIRPVYALHHILFDYGVPGDEWAPERIVLVDFILKNTKGNELNDCLWGQEGNTVMHLAYLLNQPELTQQLLDKGALTNIANKAGHLPTKSTKSTTESSANTESQPEVKLLINNNKVKSARQQKDRIPANTSDRFKRLRELAESPSAKKPSTERQNSTRRYFRPGHLEERKRQVLSEEEEAELEKQRLKRQKEVELLAQRSAVKNNPLFKKFEEQNQQKDKPVVAVPTVSAISERKKLLDVAEQVRRSSRVINSLKDRSYVSGSVFRQAQPADTASTNTLHVPTLAQLRAGSPISRDTSPNVSDNEDEDPVQPKISTPAPTPTSVKTMNEPEPSMSTKKQQSTAKSIDTSIASEKMNCTTEQQDGKHENDIAHAISSPSGTRSPIDQSGTTEDEIEALTIGKPSKLNPLASKSRNNPSKEKDIASNKVKDIVNVHERLNDEEELEIYSTGKKFSAWKRDDDNQSLEEKANKTDITKKVNSSELEPSSSTEQSVKSNVTQDDTTSSKPTVPVRSKDRPISQKITTTKASSSADDIKAIDKPLFEKKVTDKLLSNKSVAEKSVSDKKAIFDKKPEDENRPTTSKKSSSPPISSNITVENGLHSIDEAPLAQPHEEQLGSTLQASATRAPDSSVSLDTTLASSVTLSGTALKTLSPEAEKYSFDTTLKPRSKLEEKPTVDVQQKKQMFDIPTTSSLEYNASASKSNSTTPKELNIEPSSSASKNDSYEDTSADAKAYTAKDIISRSTSSSSSNSTASSYSNVANTPITSNHDRHFRSADITSPMIHDTNSFQSLDPTESYGQPMDDDADSNKALASAVPQHVLLENRTLDFTPSDDTNKPKDLDATLHTQSTNTIALETIDIIPTTKSNHTNNSENGTTYKKVPSPIDTIRYDDDSQAKNQTDPGNSHHHPEEIESDEDEATTPTLANPHTIPFQQQQQHQQSDNLSSRNIAPSNQNNESIAPEWESAYDTLMSQQATDFEDDEYASASNTDRDERLSMSSDMDEQSILKTLTSQHEARLDKLDDDWTQQNNNQILASNHVRQGEINPTDAVDSIVINHDTDVSTKQQGFDGKKRQSGSQRNHWSTGIQLASAAAAAKRESMLSSVATSEAGSEQWFDPDDEWTDQQQAELRRQSQLAEGNSDSEYYYNQGTNDPNRRSDSSSLISDAYSYKNSNSTENTKLEDEEEDDAFGYYSQQTHRDGDQKNQSEDYYSTKLQVTSATVHNTASEAIESTRNLAVSQEKKRDSFDDDADNYYSTKLHTSPSNPKGRGESSYYHGGHSDEADQEEGEIVVFMGQFHNNSSGVIQAHENNQLTNDSVDSVYVTKTEIPKEAADQFASASVVSLSTPQQHLPAKKEDTVDEDDTLSLIKIPSRTIAIAEAGTQQEMVPHDPNKPRVEDISHYMNALPNLSKKNLDVQGGSAFDTSGGGGLEGQDNDEVMVKRAISSSPGASTEQSSPAEQSRGIPNAHEINLSLDDRKTSSDAAKISMSSLEATSFGKMYIGISGAHHMLLPLPKEITYVRCVISDGEYEYMSRYEILTHQILMDYECCIDTRPGMIITVSLHVRPDYHVKPRTGWSRWFTSIRKQKEHLSGYVHPDDGAIGQTRFAVDHMVPGCYKKTYEAHFDCFNSWYARTNRERARREQFGDDEDFLKIVGKLNVEMLYLPVSNPSVQVPKTLRECDLTLKIRQWHDTCWQSGYLSTRRQGLKVWERHFYRLIGSQLIGYTSEENGNNRQVWDHYNIADVIRLSAAADKVIVTLIEEDTSKVFTESIHADNHKGFFRLTFPDYYLDCVSDDLEESEEWVKTLKSMIGRVPLRLPFSD